MLTVWLDREALRFGKHLTVTFHRTVRIPGGVEYSHPLPPSLGRLPLTPLLYDVPEAERPRPEILYLAIPIRECEALWIAFDAPEWHPHALRVGVGEIDAVSGGAWSDALGVPSQNYLVAPIQPWLDGVNAGPGRILQFVAAPLGSGDTVEERVDPGHPAMGGLRLRAYAPRPGRFPEVAPPAREPDGPARPSLGLPRSLGIGVGGGITQKIRPDPYGLETWDASASGEAHIALFDPEQFRQLTGRNAPPEAINAETYARLGLPWFELDDESDARGLPPAEAFRKLEGSRDADVAGSPKGLRVHRIRRRQD